MPVTFTADHATRRILAVATGTLSLDEYLAHVRARAASGVLAYEQVLVMRAATFGFGTAALEPILDAIRAGRNEPPQGNTAIVAVDDATYWLARQFCSCAELLGYRAERFRSVTEAEEWLRNARSVGEHVTPR